MNKYDEEAKTLQNMQVMKDAERMALMYKGEMDALEYDAYACELSEEPYPEDIAKKYFAMRRRCSRWNRLHAEMASILAGSSREEFNSIPWGIGGILSDIVMLQEKYE